jgi:two-component system sensor histidine kinase VicK
MSSTDVQLRFAAEFAVFLVALAGIGFAFLRSDLLVVRPVWRWPAATGFLLLGVASFLSGALIIDDAGDGRLVALRAAGIVLVALASTAWRTDRGGRELLRIGVVALVVAETAVLSDKADNIVSVALTLGALGIGASLLAVSTRLISARIAATGAMILLAVITVVAVTFSAVISDNIENEALRRYSARAESEALAVQNASVPDLLPARLLAAAFGTTQDRALSTALGHLTDPAAARSEQQLAADRVPVVTVIQGFLTLLNDGRQRPTLIVQQGLGARVAVPPELDQTFVAELTGSRAVQQAVSTNAEATSVEVVADAPLAISAAPIVRGQARGIVVVTSRLDSSYMRLRLASLDQEQPDSGIALANGDLVLSTAGLFTDVDTVSEVAAAAMNDTGDPVRITADRFVVAHAVRAQDGTPVMAVVLSVPRVQVDATREELYRILFLVAMGAATAALVLAAVAGERIGAGLRRLTAAATAIQAGNLDVRTGVSSDDEIGALGASFDAMADSLRLKTGELRLAAKEEAELRLRLEAVVAGMSEALVAVDAKGRVTSFNAAAEELCNLPARAARGRLVESVVRLRSTDGSPLGERLGQPVLEAWNVTGMIVQSGGKEVPVAVSAGALRAPDGEVTGAVFVLRDVRREQELDRMKTEFLATISHELRTPLTPIKGFASILSTRDLPKAKAKGFADEISAAADQLERVIGQLVNFATIVGGRLSIDSEPVAMRPLVDECVKSWRGRADGTHKFVRRVAAKVPRVVADRSYLVQAIDELLDNAVKYSPQGGSIVVEARLVELDSVPAMEISVTDQGVGIAQDRLESILGDFTQGDSSATRRFGGLGLGLAFVQRVARAHGGDLSIWSAGGSGTRAAIVLPLDGPPGGSPA